MQGAAEAFVLVGPMGVGLGSVEPGLDSGILMGPFQLGIFCDCVVLSAHGLILLLC